jgi:hypothetical protein
MSEAPEGLRVDERRLAAILAADVAGYSRLMGRNEEETVRDLGDIIHDGTRTYGDGINVAARLEPLAEPGGICISSTVRDAIFGKLGLPLRDIGEKTLKNIDRPVHIYQIQAPGTRVRRDWLGAGLRQYRRFAPALGLVVLLAAGAWRFWPRVTPGSDALPILSWKLWIIPSYKSNFTGVRAASRAW